MLAADVTGKMVFTAKSLGVELAAVEGTVVLLSVWVVFGKVAHQVFAILEALVALGANVLAAHVRSVGAEMVSEVALGWEAGVAVAADEVASGHLPWLSTGAWARRGACGRG